MWILCVLIRLFQLVILLMLSGILFSIAAISRLMEIIIILIHPTAVFLLRQSANLIVLSTILIAKTTSSACHELYGLVKCDRQEAVLPRESLRGRKIASLQIGMQTPFVPYKRSALDETSKYPFVEDGSIAGPSAMEGNGRQWNHRTSARPVAE
ncbi:uncharacterized protein LOC105182132 [Harpegnathos saltator]|uniref:uncharacterized protein LOC105182132 n=1 Tax=Harpegnathos saltator TaxID=610380 RepID=UPI00058CF6CB|nr:uncharacterized protein LOC105182132 [Harpegnathos saltator]